MLEDQVHKENERVLPLSDFADTHSPLFKRFPVHGCYARLYVYQLICLIL